MTDVESDRSSDTATDKAGDDNESSSYKDKDLLSKKESDSVDGNKTDEPSSETEAEPKPSSDKESSPDTDQTSNRNSDTQSDTRAQSSQSKNQPPKTPPTNKLQNELPRLVQFMLIGGLVAILILSAIMILLAILLFNIQTTPAALPPTTSSTVQAPFSTAPPFKEQITLPMAIHGSLNGEPFSPKWTVNGSFYEKDDFGNLVMTDSDNLTNSELIIVNTTLANYSASYKVSNDGKFVVFKNITQAIYRHSTKANYTVVEIESANEIFTLANIRTFVWNPAAGKSDFVYVNDAQNIVYVANPYNSGNKIMITNSSDPLQFYGIPDWLYEEEITSSDSTIWWSPDGSSIAYLHMNDTGVHTIQYSIYKKDNQYPIINTVPYPKVGTKNPTVHLYVANLTAGATPILATLPSVVSNLGDYYVFTVQWVDSQTLVVPLTNRAQTHVYFAKCSAPTYNCQLWMDWEYNQGGLQQWADPSTLNIIPTGQNSFLTIVPYQSLDKSNVYDEIINVSLKVPNKFTVVSNTSDTYDVLGIKAYHNNTVYYTMAYPVNGKSLWSAAASGPGKYACISCGIQPFQNCSYSMVNFSPTKDRYIVTCSSIYSVPVSYYVSLANPNGLMTMENNSALANKLTQYALPTYSFQKVPMNNGFTASVKLSFPPNFDSTKKYPVLLYVYSGPGTVAVQNRAKIGFDEYITGTREYISVRIDTRGSGQKGWKIMSQMYANSGTVEIDDTIAVMKTLLDSNAYMDSNKVGIWGWSYGGYATAAVVEHQTMVAGYPLFQCAVSVAPVTDFTYYDTAYTERFMNLYEDNKQGYRRTNLNANVTAFHDLKRYLLMHGNADDVPK